MESKLRFIVVRPWTLPDFTIDRIWPCTMASLKRTGSIAVAVNLSPTRDCLVDNVSFKRIFKLVPTGTSGAVVLLGTGFRKTGLVVWALARAGKMSVASRTVRALILLKFIDSSLG